MNRRKRKLELNLNTKNQDLRNKNINITLQQILNGNKIHCFNASLLFLRLCFASCIVCSYFFMTMNNAMSAKQFLHHHPTSLKIISSNSKTLLLKKLLSTVSNQVATRARQWCRTIGVLDFTNPDYYSFNEQTVQPRKPNSKRYLNINDGRDIKSENAFGLFLW